MKIYTITYTENDATHKEIFVSKKERDERFSVLKELQNIRNLKKETELG